MEGVITSPGYPDMYPNDLKCGYNISSLLRSYAYSTITIIFDELDMEFHEKCDYDFVLVSRCITICKFEPIINTEIVHINILDFVSTSGVRGALTGSREHEPTATIWLGHGYCRNLRERKKEGSWADS